MCLEFLDSAITDIINENPRLSSAANEIKKVVAERIEKSEYLDERIREGMPHARIVYNLLENACRWKLCSCELHVHRGMLGMFAGEDMALWESIVQRAAQFEGVYQEQIDALRADLREDISQAW